MVEGELIGSERGGDAASPPVAAEREAELLREREQDARRESEILKRNAHRLAGAASPREVAETTMLEVKALGIAVAELTSLADRGLVVLASLGLGADAVARIESAPLSSELPSAVAMQTNAQVSIRPEAPSRPYPPSSPDPDAPAVGEILAWPLHSATGSVLGALSVGLREPLARSGLTRQVLVGLVQQSGLALGRALEADRRQEVEEELTQTLRAAAEQERYRAVLGDALRANDAPEDVHQVAARLLGQHLRASRVRYAGFDDGDVDRYGPVAMDALGAGHTVCVEDASTDGRVGAAEREAASNLGVAAYVLVPLIRQGRPVAVLVVDHDAPRAWTAAEIKLIEETAERTQATVERASAVAALGEREARYRSLFTAIDEGFCLCEIVTDDDGRPIDYRFLEVNPRFTEQTGLVDPVGRRARDMVPDLEDHWVQTMGRVALDGETVRYENRAEGLHRWFDVYAAPVEPIGGGRFVVVVNDVTERHQAEETLRDNAETARRGRARSELVTSVMRDLEAIDRLAALGQRLVSTLVPRFADYALLEIPGRLEPVLALAHRDPDKGEILRTLRDEHRVMASANSVARAAAGEPRLIEQVDDEMLAHLAAGSSAVLALLEQLAARSHIAVPIDFGGEAGALLLGLSDPGRPRYGSEDLALAEEIAYRVSILFAHARVREEEHAIGVRLQRALLPEALLDHPAVQVAARYQTGSDLLYVGGDWYDTLPLPDGRLALTVGDVVGHGLDAAASMSRMRIALAALAPQVTGPGELLSRLADFSTGANGVQFATATCSFLDPGTGELSYSSAGHPPALVVSPDGTSRWLEGGRSMPVGAVTIACDRPDEHDRLKPGDLLIMYSDGLVERRREPIGAGLARLQAAAQAAVDLPVEDLCQRLVAQLAAVSTNDDDAVIMCLRFSPVTLSAFHRRVPAEPGELATTRAAIRAWLRRRQDPASVGHRLLLAVGEALTNAVEHAYLGRAAGAIDLSIEADGRGVMRVRVRDHGRWREAASRPGRGHGFRVIQGLTRGMERESDDAGTTVRFELPILEVAE